MSERILAIDYGRKRIGFAVTDETQIAISTLPVLLGNAPDFRKKLAGILAQYEPSLVVLGFPGSHEETPLQREIREFKRSLEKITNAPVILFEESHSSLEAQEVMRATGSAKPKTKTKKKEIDSVAAGVVLRRYLESIS